MGPAKLVRTHPGFQRFPRNQESHGPTFALQRTLPPPRRMDFWFQESDLYRKNTGVVEKQQQIGDPGIRYVSFFLVGQEHDNYGDS